MFIGVFKSLDIMVRVVFVHPDLGIGGAERAVVDAALALKSRGHSVTFLTAHHDSSHCFQETRDGTLKASVYSVSGKTRQRNDCARFPLDRKRFTPSHPHTQREREREREGETYREREREREYSLYAIQTIVCKNFCQQPTRFRRGQNYFSLRQTSDEPHRVCMICFKAHEVIF